MHLNCQCVKHAVCEPLTKVGRVRVAVAQRVLENDARSARSAEAKKRESDLPDLPRCEGKLIGRVFPIVANDVNTQVENVCHVHDDHRTMQHVGYMGFRSSHGRRWRRRVLSHGTGSAAAPRQPVVHSRSLPY